MAGPGVLPRKNTLGWDGINESGRGEAAEKECKRGAAGT